MSQKRGRRMVWTSVAACLAIMVVASTAWACTTAQGPFVHDLFTRRGPVGTTVTVEGGGWEALSTVQVAWRPAGGSLRDLATVVTDPDGSFSAPIVVPTAPVGVHQVAVTQGSTARLTPFEVTSDIPSEADRAQFGAAPRGGPLEDFAIPSDRDGVDGGAIATFAAVGVASLAALAVADMRRRRLRAVR